MSNPTMNRICSRVTGETLKNGKEFMERIKSGDLLSGVKLAEVPEEDVVVLPEGEVIRFWESDTIYEQHHLTMVVATEITEIFEKMQELRRKQQELVELNTRLAEVNEEIVALTAEREVLNAKVRIHDDLGASLLSIKSVCVNGGSEEELAAIADRIHRSIDFLKADTEVRVRDEYELMLDTAKELGVKVVIAGILPQYEPAKHILSVALHECITNTLRHAHGDRLSVELEEDEKTLTAVFKNNGEQPIGEICEKGGLVSLREMTEAAGGEMEVCTVPVFAVIIRLPKGEDDAL